MSQRCVCVSLSSTPQMCCRVRMKLEFPSSLGKWRIFPHGVPCGASCLELNSPAVWQDGWTPHLACSLYSCYLLGSQVPQVSLSPCAWGSVRRKAGRRLASLPWHQPRIQSVNCSLTSLVGWRVSCIFSLRSQLCCVLPSPVCGIQSVPRQGARGLVWASLTPWVDVLSSALGVFLLGSFSLLFLFFPLLALYHQD